MRQNNRIVQFISGLPSSIMSAIPNAHSDWIRYGLPAVLLTAIFLVVMRYEADQLDSVPARPAAVQLTHPPAQPRSFPVPESVSAARPEMPPRKLEAERSPMQQFNPPRPPVPYGQPVPAVLAGPQDEGRRAVCGSVQWALARVRPRNRKVKAMKRAIEAYRGQGGPQAADAAISRALADYGSGKWDEGQCPPTGGPPLAKGAIAQVMR